MQSAVNPIENNILVPADVLRGMTVSKDEIAKRQKENTLQDIMSSMVRLATEQGATSFSANFQVNSSQSFIDSIADELKALGYTVTSELVNNSQLGNVLSMNITWGQ